MSIIKGGMVKILSDVKKSVRNLVKPENLNIIEYIRPYEVPFDPVARLKCYQCGIFYL